MKKILLIASIVLTTFFAQAQSLDRNVISSGGGFVSRPTAIISYTIGETAIQFLATPTVSLSQGFQQVNNTITSVRQEDKSKVIVRAFPNPFTHSIEITTEELLKDPQFKVVDALGRKIDISVDEKVDGRHWVIEFGDIPHGNYWFHISTDGKREAFQISHLSP